MSLTPAHQLNFINQSQVLRSHLGIAPLRTIQSWDVGGERMKWKSGDLAVHFAGCWVKHECEKKWEKYWKKRGRAPVRKKKKPTGVKGMFTGDYWHGEDEDDLSKKKLKMRRKRGMRGWKA